MRFQVLEDHLIVIAWPDLGSIGMAVPFPWAAARVSASKTAST